MGKTSKTCKECNGEVIFDEYTICIACGLIQDSQSFIENSTLTDFGIPANQGGKFVEHHETRSNTQGFKNFKDMYFSITYNLNSPYSMVEKGKQLLTKLYKDTMYYHFKRKISLLAAMLYCLYKQENHSGTARQFQEKVGLDLHDFNKSLQDVRAILDFPSSFKSEDLLNNALDRIIKLSSIVLKPGANKLISQADLIALASRLTQVIHTKQWVCNTNISTLSYVEQVSAVSTVLAGHYCVASISSRKDKSGQKKCFRFSTMDLKKVANFSSVTERTLWKWMKSIQDHLFSIYKNMLVKPGIVEKSIEIGKVLVELLDYIDLDIDGTDTDKGFEEELEDLKLTKSFLLRRLQQFINSKKLELFSEIWWESFVECLKDEQKNHQELKGSEINLKPKVFISICGHVFHIQHVELMRDLLNLGCSVEEIEHGQMSTLCKRYIESQEECDVELDEDEIDSLIKKPHEILDANEKVKF